MIEKYPLTHERREQLIVSQKGECAICGGTNDHTKDLFTPSLAEDHDHKTGYFRGFLCRRCNLGLGYFKDSIRRLRSAARYLEDFERRLENEGVFVEAQ